MTSQRTKFLPIPGFPNYRISNTGEVQSCLRQVQPVGGAVWRPSRDWRTIKPTPDRDGYLRVRICNRCMAVHSLVLLAFVGPKPIGMQARHLNGFKTDNRADNLRWGTCKENHQDRILHGTSPRGNNASNRILSESDIPNIRFRLLWEPGAWIAEDYSVTPQAISHINKRKNWAHS